MVAPRLLPAVQVPLAGSLRNLISFSLRKILLLAAAQLASALDPDRSLSQYRQSSWDALNGLTQSSALALAQSPDTGYVWIGTERGLVRFDGSRFVPFEHPSRALANRRVTALAIGEDASLWVATMQALFEFQPRKNLLIPAPRSPCVTRVSTLHRPSFGGPLLVGTEGGLLCRLDSGRWQPVGPPANRAPVLSVAISPAGDAWLGTSTASGISREALPIGSPSPSPAILPSAPYSPSPSARTAPSLPALPPVSSA